MEWYEALEPDPDDEYYDEQCKAAWADMFSRGFYDSESIEPDLSRVHTG